MRHHMQRKLTEMKVFHLSGYKNGVHVHIRPFGYHDMCGSRDWQYVAFAAGDFGKA